MIEQNNKESRLLRVTELLKGIVTCYKQGLHLPALILTYTCIDAVGALDTPPSEKQSRKSFVDWVNKYLLPSEPQLPCSATDLYAARCALLHSFTPDSDMSTAGKAKRLVYVSGDGDEDQRMNAAISLIEASQPNAVAVNIKQLIRALMKGLQTFQTELLADPARAQRVHDRADFYFGISSECGRELLQQIDESIVKAKAEPPST